MTTEAQILELIADSQRSFGMAVMLITHNLGVVAEIADEVVVMYLGKVVEQADVVSLFYAPQHPYTQALLESIPRIGKRVEELEVIVGSVPDPHEHPDRLPLPHAVPGVPAGALRHGSAGIAGSGTRAHSTLPEAVAAGGAGVGLETATADIEKTGGDAAPLLEVKDLKKHFPIQRGLLRRTVGHVRAVDGVSFTIGKGQTYGLVGESGSGKTTTGRMLMRAIEPTAGEIWFQDGALGRVNVADLDTGKLRQIRRNMKIIYQDPYSSLNPRMTVLQVVGEHLLVNKLAQGKALEERVAELLQLVGLRPEYMRRYPHAFSGGQRQRLAIARALSMQPQLIVCDEPVSALDVSVQAQILKLLHNLQGQFGLSYLFVAHDLSVVENVSDRVSVMYVGKIVETASTEELYRNPLHPYTEALLSAVPRPDPKAKKKRIILQGEAASPANPPAGCHFHPRCPYAVDRCRSEVPTYVELRPQHFVSCHRAAELDLKGVVGAE